MTKKLTYEDLQPHVDMLCDALENRGASSSGIPNENVYPYADKYRALLRQVRSENIDLTILVHDLQELRICTLLAAKDNQLHRIAKIVQALDIFIIKEYNKNINRRNNYDL